MGRFSVIYCGDAEFTGNVTVGGTLAVIGAITAPTLVLTGAATLSTHAMRKGEVESAIGAAVSGLSATYQPLNAQLTAIALLTTASFGRSLLVLPDAAAGRTALGLSSAATGDAGGLTTGTLDISRLPALPAYNTIVTTNLAALTSPEQATIVAGTRVITSDDGKEQRYLGSGSKTDSASYTFVSDSTPDWTLLTSKPANVISLGNLTLAADRLLYSTGVGTLALATLTSVARDLLDDANAATMRSTLGVVIGTDVQAYRAELVKLGVHGTDVASASTINLETATGDLVDVTGTTGITAVTLSEGHIRRVKFNGILTLTHGSSLILPTAAAITTAVGDIATFAGYAAGVVRLVDYQRADGTPLAGGGGGTLDPAPYNAGSISGSVTLNRANGLFQKATVAASLTLLAPSGGSEGKRLELWLTDSGASGSVDLHASILIPSDSSISFPRTLATGKLHSLILKHNGSNWMLVQFIGGY